MVIGGLGGGDGTRGVRTDVDCMKDDERNPCSYAQVLATLLALVGAEVELTVSAKPRLSRHLICGRGVLNAGPELGSDEDALIPVRVGGTDLVLKRAWLVSAWRGRSRSWLALLFEGDVLVEIERVADSAPS